MLFAVVLESQAKRSAEIRCDIPRRQFTATYRILAEYSSRRCGTWAVTILETSALLPYLLELFPEKLCVRAIPVNTPEEGFDLARRMIQRRSRNPAICLN